MADETPILPCGTVRFFLRTGMIDPVEALSEAYDPPWQFTPTEPEQH